MNLKVQIVFYDNTRYWYIVDLDSFGGFRCTRTLRLPEVCVAGDWMPVLSPHQTRALMQHGLENIYGVDVGRTDDPREVVIYARFHKEDDPAFQGKDDAEL